MSYLDSFKLKTRWNSIPNNSDGYRLLCSNPDCSLSCANIRNGRLAVTSIHGDERHSYVLSKNDMAFTVVEFLNHLTKEDLEKVVRIFNKQSPELVLILENL